MHQLYSDILNRIEEPPQWYDQNGVPRFDPFTPDQCPDIYANIVWLSEIECQGCGQHFKVELHHDWSDSSELEPKDFGWGDPPAHCCIGDSMCSFPVRVLEVWDRPKFEWIRHPEKEGDVIDE